MSKKDYIQIASVLQNWNAHTHVTEIEYCALIGSFSVMLQADNSRFDSERFAEACHGK
jgi:hypothetical protein